MKPLTILVSILIILSILIPLVASLPSALNKPTTINPGNIILPSASNKPTTINPGNVNTQLFAPYIHVNLIKVAPAAPGNSKPVNVSVNVTSRVTQKDICGLNASNFKIDGSAFIIANVLPIQAWAINQPTTCDYWLSIVPTSPWVSGIHGLALGYIQGGQQIANVTLIFRV
jgi:hypothetical protein